MATTTKKGGNKKSAKRPRAVKTSLTKRAPTDAKLRHELAESLQRENAAAIEITRLLNELDAHKHQLTEAFEQQTATCEILGIIARSATDVQPVMNVVAENAARLCDANNALIGRVEGSFIRRVATYGPIAAEFVPPPVSRSHPVGRAILEKQTLHIYDIAAEIETEFPESRPMQQISGARTILVTPLMLEDEVIGHITIRRTEVRPFSDSQIKLLKTFADQAVIAIENVRLFQELKESLEQQTATSEILQVIASSPTDLQPVFETILANATRLCGTHNAGLYRFDGELLHFVAGHNLSPVIQSRAESRPVRPGKETATRLAALERRTIHVPDVLASAEFAEYQTEFVRSVGRRSTLAVPLLKENTLLGVITTSHFGAVRPFTNKQIKLVETFADQAVIAIENVRLFKELGERNAELREALEHQTATAEVLGIISRSPTDVQPVLDEIVASAVRVCGIDDVTLRLREGKTMVVRAHSGPIPVPTERAVINIDDPRFSWMGEHGSLHIPDVSQQNDFPIVNVSGSRTFLIVPLRQQGEILGTLSARRVEVRPFTPAQIKLLETFADQAVIAIENVRLFQELKESLEQQTATSEILGVIASSPTDLQPVLDIIAKNAARICNAGDATIRLVEGNLLRFGAHYGSIPVGTLPTTDGQGRPIDRDSVVGRVVLDRRLIHLDDLSGVVDTEFPARKLNVAHHPIRTMLAVPLMREDVAIGVIALRRTEVRPFSERQIALLKTFADQAVIAVENVRLFNELKESLEQQTATSEILGAIASSPTDLEPVLKIITERATRVCGAEDGVLRLVDGNVLRLAAHYGPIPDVAVERPINRQSPPGRALVDQTIIHYEDVDQVVESDYPEVRETHHRLRTGTFLAVPLIREGVGLGVIHFRRLDVRPFSDKQIALIKTFADQAVIAIENVRLFKELQERNAELREALEHQTATSEVLSIISRSPTDVQPVLDAIVESAARVCGVDDIVLRLREGNGLLARAHFGAVPIAHGREEISIDELHHRWIAQHGTLHIPDVRAHRDEFPTLGASVGARSLTFLIVPLRQRGEFIGTLNARRTEVRPFTPAQIKLLETFADQAVIAIENVRLFKELDERTNDLTRSVGELRALGEVSQVVSSTLDLEAVLTRIVSHAVQLSATDGGAIYEYDEPTEEFHLRATDHMEEELINALRANPPRLGDGVVGRAAASREPVQVPNILEERAYAPRMRQLLERFGFRASLAVPLLREDRIIGGLVVRRKSTGEFRPEVIELLKTFATQSVLAIQNARLFREIEEKSQQIQAANRHKSEFLANMSHELRTPLNAIIGFSEVLQEKLFGELNEKQAEYTDDILTSGRHLLSLINEILDLSKVEAGRMELELAAFDLPLAIDNARTFVRERATSHGITLEVKVDERLGEYVGDERKIKQILLNLLSNAVKFTPEGGRIEIAARQTNGSVEISVSDTGIGIAEQDQPKIFEEFRQVGSDYAHKVEGTGLGLTLAKKFVELHGGRIWVESEPGMGSTFVFTLPTKLQVSSNERETVV